MALYEFEGKRPQIGETSFVPETADVIGDVVCILHNCTVKDNAVIGIGAILTDFSVVGDWAIVGEGAVVRGEIPDGAIAVGVPAKAIGQVTDKQKSEWQYYKDKYAELASVRYPRGLKRIG